MKRALLIGVAYTGTNAALEGTTYDVEQMEDVLVKSLGYTADDITILAEREAYHGTHAILEPTRANIEAQLIRLAEECVSNSAITEVLWQYSGHGAYVKDPTGSADEDDGKDECLVPLDYIKAGLIRDDTINAILSLFPKHVTFIGLMDACHSGTVFDLPYRYITGNKYVIESETSRIQCRCIMLSGCRDDQTSADAYNLANAKEYSGAMTTSFRAALKVHGYCVSVWQLQKHMWAFLKKRKFSQRPQVTTNVRLNRGTLFINRNRVAPFIQ